MDTRKLSIGIFIVLLFMHGVLGNCGIDQDCTPVSAGGIACCDSTYCTDLGDLLLDVSSRGRFFIISNHLNNALHAVCSGTAAYAYFGLHSYFHHWL